MEALERLRSVHATLRLMREHALCSSGGDGGQFEMADRSSDRFVADFFLFLVRAQSQRSPDAEELKEKCDFLMKRLPEVSITFLQALVVENCTLEVSRSAQDAAKVPIPGCESLSMKKSSTVISPVSKIAFSLNGGKDKSMMFTEQNYPGSKSQRPLPQDASEERSLATQLVPLVGLRAMERANTTLEDFCRSYFMFHEMDVHNPQHLFKHLPILSFVEAFIYQVDEENEEQVQCQNRSTVAFLSLSARQGSPGDPYAPCDESTEEAGHAKAGLREQGCSCGSSHSAGLGMQCFSGLRHALANHGLLTERIESELRDGVEYWRLEQTLCESVTNGIKINAEDVLRAIRLKSFDYRVLNLLLYSLTGKEVNEAHLNFLAVSELLVEISDDLFDYEDDVLKNSFNVLRMLVKVYGPVKAPEMLAKLISEEEMRYQHLLERLEPSLVGCYQQRCKEATKEGGNGSKHQFGSWSMPHVIVDEMEYRAHLCNTPPH